jgi:hypothetical protein
MSNLRVFRAPRMRQEKARNEALCLCHSRVILDDDRAGEEVLWRMWILFAASLQLQCEALIGFDSPFIMPAALLPDLGSVH